MHRNSLRYRLARAEQVLGRSLKQPSTIAAIYIALVADERRAPHRIAAMDASEQPTAPYLDAVVSYAFRGPARYHVPGHKGGPGADPGLRKAIGVDALAMDIPQDIHGDRSRPVADGVRARRAARRRRLRRGAHVLPHQRRDPGQPCAVPGAGAAGRARSSRSATRTRRSSTGSC